MVISTRPAASQIGMDAATEADAERRQRLRDLFGGDYMNEEERELARVPMTSIRQPKPAEPAPKWKQQQPEGDARASRLSLWLEARGVSLDRVLLVPAGERRIAVVTATDVSAGDTVFDVPGELLMTAESALDDPEVGRDLRIIQSRGAGDGFDTFAIATLLAAERVRRGSVRGRLRRQDGGTQIGAVNLARDGRRGELLPEWRVQGVSDLQSNLEWAPFVASLAWPEGDECRVDPERADAVEQGAALIAKLIEPVARKAWMQSTQRKGGGIVQSTSDEDVSCRAVEALLLAMESQLEPPPPLGAADTGDGDGERLWGGRVGGGNGPALCPLVNLVLPPSEFADAARAAGAINAELGRPTADGAAGVAVRCVAARDLPAGTMVLCDESGAS